MPTILIRIVPKLCQDGDLSSSIMWAIGQKDYTPTPEGGVELYRRFPAEFDKVEPEEAPF